MRLRHRDLRVLEERQVLLVPRLRALGPELVAAGRAPERSPQRHVPALVVADRRLRPNVAEDDVDLASHRDVGGHGVQLDHAAPGVDAVAGGHRHRVAVVVHVRDHCVGEPLVDLAKERAVDGDAHTRAASNTFGATSVRPPSHRSARRGVISMMTRSQKSGSATRFA